MPIQTTRPRRSSLTPAHVATRIAAANRPPDKLAHKPQIVRVICGARPKLSVSERALELLSRDDADRRRRPHRLSADQAALPAHARHGGFVDAGLIVRRGSPNGKRYARKGRGGAIKLAFDFDLAPLAARAEAFQRPAEPIEAEARAIRLAKEPVTLCRRDIAKMIATGEAPTGHHHQAKLTMPRRHIPAAEKLFATPVLVRATRRLQSRSPKRTGGQ
jgi:replication initiation protein RepC